MRTTGDEEVSGRKDTPRGEKGRQQAKDKQQWARSASQ